MLGLSPVATFRKVVFPAAIPTIFTGVRLVILTEDVDAAREALEGNGAAG